MRYAFYVPCCCVPYGKVVTPLVSFDRVGGAFLSRFTIIRLGLMLACALCVDMLLVCLVVN